MENRADHRQKIGSRGEDIACRHLEGMGHRVLERNWRSGHLEIDIISVGEDGIHFVEVKARQRNIQAPPQNNVDALKQKRIVKAALAYLNKSRKLPGKDMECFFDVAAVTFDDKGAHLEWIPQAYIPFYL